ncbi:MULTISPECIES: universal stress protein [unclassified Variovorax]|uniref:universal stress protein n=1 Tax=unclassified Variovorax TaxID=663243 RepID=UPI00257620A4|nr:MULTISPECIES: universal stress protein [unclassified Variovorax]MDM0091130.1 universal stress protein [Variovorax sp. J22G40]MDM0148868.1 universal stress protein [Variovorax sp. J2P1-31]
MNIQSILALTDLSAPSRRAVARAGLIAAEHRALLKILYAAPALGRCADSDAAARTSALAQEIAARFGILVKCIPHAPGSGHLADVRAAARRVDLLVVDADCERGSPAGFGGSPVTRLLRAVACPVLVTQREALHRYRRLLVAVDFTPASQRMVGLAWALDGTAEVELFHALSGAPEGRLRLADASEQALKASRHQRLGEARERMFWLSDSAPPAPERRVVSAIGQGDPARQAAVQQQARGAELLVVGKRQRHGPLAALADFLLGSVAQRVLGMATADVLVVPYATRTQPEAADARLGTGMKAVPR